jgi:hypothetical protein
MSECNCCCAYLSPPWWVTMGYVPPGANMPTGNVQPRTPPNSQPPEQPPTRTPPGSVVVSAPPPAIQTMPPRTQTTPAGARPSPAVGVARVIGDLATGNVIAALGDALGLL